MDAERLHEIRVFYRALVPRLRDDKASLSGLERETVIRYMGELIAHARQHPGQTKLPPSDGGGR